MKFTNAKEIINRIETRRGHANLEMFKKYMEEKGNEHLTIPSIHVAGTNGKGSTTNFLRSILQKQGYRVGTLTSPSMVCHLDRIRINDEWMEEEAFIRYANEYYEEWVERHLTMFEIDTFLAAHYFKEKKVDFVIYEVGLGGEKDTTNLIAPMVSIITNIGYDHMAILGDSLEEIALAKAGIIKEKIPLISGEDKPVCQAIFDEKARMMHTQVTYIEAGVGKLNEVGVYFDYKGYNIQLSTSALYQRNNACCAIETVLCLRGKGIEISDEALLNGLKEAFWLGRFEVMCQDPLIIIDGAHNAHGIKALVQSLQGIKNPSFLVSIMKDKNIHMMMELLHEISQNITVVDFENSRVAHEEDYALIPFITFSHDYKKEIDEALKQKDPYIITGSLYFIAEVRKYLKNKLQQ